MSPSIPMLQKSTLLVLYLIKEGLQILSTAWTPGLSSIPAAHWTAPYSQAWILYQRGSKNEHSARQAAHGKMGPVIRLGPRELSVNCVEGGLRTVYGENWDKSSFYAAFENYGHHPLFSMAERKEHAARKRLLAHVYTKSYIDNSLDVAKLLSVMNGQRLLPLLHEKSSLGKPVEVLLLSGSYFMDAVTAFLYGLQNSTNLLQHPVEAKALLSAFDTSLGPDTFFLLNFPRLTGLLARVGWHLVPAKVFECFPVFLGFGQRLHNTTKASTLVVAEKPGSSNTDQQSAPVVWSHFRQAMINAEAGSKNSELTPADAEKLAPNPELDNIIAAEMLDHLHAAHLASGILVTYTLWELSRRPEVQSELIVELKHPKSHGKDLTRSSSAGDSLLERVLLETMRLHPPAFGPFPRVVPPEGAKLGSGEVETATVPGGTVVSASPYTLGRNPDVFDRPDEWDPARWEDDKSDSVSDSGSASGRHTGTNQGQVSSRTQGTKTSAERRREMQKWVWAFGSGARVCIGKHFAELTMKSMLVSIYENFSTELVEVGDGADKGMQHVEAMMAAPKAGKLMLNFYPLPE